MSLALSAIAGGAVLMALNSTMLAVALPSIMAEFSVGAGTVSWLVTLYLASVALALPISGTLGDRFGHRRMFVAGVVAFGCSSLLGALAWSFPVLAVSRVLQAVSGASITPNASSLIKSISPEDRRGASFGLFDMLISTSAAAGPFLGGLLTGRFGWRSLFVIAIPIALASAAVISVAVPGWDRGGEERPPLDVTGLAVLSLLLLTLLAAISGVRSHGVWTVPTALAVPVLLGIFVAWELRTPVPAVDVRLFKVPPFAAAVAAVLGATVVLHATMILVPILTQNLMGATPRISGAVLLAFFGIGAVTAPFGGRLSDLLGRRVPAVAGSLCIAVGLAGLWSWTGRTSLVGVAGMLAVIGLGFGLSGSPRQTSALESVPYHLTGMAAGTYFTSRYLGGVLGASLAGVILAGDVTAPIVADGFGILAVVACFVTAASFGLRGARRPAQETIRT